MRKLVLVLVAVGCCMSFVCSLYASTLQGGVLFTRSNLRAEGTRIFWHNMSSLKAVIPVGTEVKSVTDVGGWIEFTVADGNKQYRLVVEPKYWDKYFVKNRNDLGLDKLSEAKKQQVMSSEVVVGMTKEEVYASKGCPAYIAWGKTTERNSLNEIMQSDKWYYMASSRGHDVMVTFGNGVVVKTGGFGK